MGGMGGRRRRSDRRECRYFHTSRGLRPSLTSRTGQRYNRPCVWRQHVALASVTNPRHWRKRRSEEERFSSCVNSPEPPGGLCALRKMSRGKAMVAPCPLARMDLSSATLLRCGST
jgi:hypothetical protein